MDELNFPDFPEVTTDTAIITASSMIRDTEASANARGRSRMNALIPLPPLVPLSLAYALPLTSTTGSSGSVKDGSLASVSGAGPSSLFVVAFPTTCPAIVQIV